MAVSDNLSWSIVYVQLLRDKSYIFPSRKQSHFFASIVCNTLREKGKLKLGQHVLPSRLVLKKKRQEVALFKKPSQKYRFLFLFTGSSNKQRPSSKRSFLDYYWELGTACNLWNMEGEAGCVCQGHAC
jgi:hypothetical protein